MSFYLCRARFSTDGVKGLMANPQDREAAVAKHMAAMGGKLHHYFFAFGEFDAVMLVEAPDNATAAAAVMAAAGTGSVSAVETTVLMTMDEAMTAMKKAGSAGGSYTPPGG